MTCESMFTASNTLRAPVILSKRWSIHCALLAAMFNLLHSSKINKYLERISAIKAAAIITDDFHYENMPPPNWHISLSAKMNEGCWWIHCMYCGMPKGTFRDEVTLNGENIRPVVLPIIELCFTEGIRYAGSQSVGWSVGRSVGRSVRQSVRQSVSQWASRKYEFFKNSVAT